MGNISKEEFRHLSELFVDPYECDIAKDVQLPTKLKDINDIFGVHISTRKNNEIALLDIDHINDNEIVFDESKHHQVRTLLKRLRGVASHAGSVKRINRDCVDYYFMQNVFKEKVMLKGMIAVNLIDDFAKSLYNAVLGDIRKQKANNKNQ